MTAHVVLFKLKASVSEEQLRFLDHGLRSLTCIPGVVSVDCGPTNDKFYPGYTMRNAEYNYGLVIVLNDEKALEVYDKHEYHDKIKKTCIFPILDSSKPNPVLAYDFNGYKVNKSSIPGEIFLVSSIFALGAAVIVLMPLIRSRL